MQEDDEDHPIFRSLAEVDRTERFAASSEGIRNRLRISSETVAGVYADALQAGLPKDVAKALMICSLACLTGFDALVSA